MSSSSTTSAVQAAGERGGILVAGIGIGYLVAVDAANSDAVSNVGLVTVTVGILVAGYF